MTSLMQDQEWYADALCAQTDPEEFFPEKGGTTRYAKAICNGDPTTDRQPCPVKEQCLTWALVNDERFGIYGGFSERERRKMPKPTTVLAATGTDATVPVPAAAVDEQPAPPRQYGLPYVGGANGGGHYPLPNPDQVVRIEQRGNAKSSIDWDAIRAQHEERRRQEGTLDQQPTTTTTTQLRCRWCRKPAEDLVDDVCGDCRHDAEQQFTVPTPVPADVDVPVEALPTLEEELLADIAELDGPAPSDEVAEQEAPAGDIRPKDIPADVTPLDVVAYCEQLLRDTAGDQRPLVRVLRNNALSALAALDLVAHPETPVAVSAHTAVPETPVQGHPDTATGTTPRRRRRSGSGPKGDEADIVRLYTEDQMSSGEIALQLHTTAKRVRAVLDRAGIERRDDRTTRSGGKPKDYPAEFVTDVRRLYLDQQLSQAEVAAQLDTTVKVVQNVMARHDIPARPSASASSKAGIGRPIKLDDTKVDQLVERYMAGESATALAKAFGVSVPSVLNRLRQRDVQIRGRGGNHRAAS